MLQDHGPDLPDLVDLGFASITLEIHFFFDARFSKDVVTSSDTLLESKAEQQPTQVFKRNICI